MLALAGAPAARADESGAFPRPAQLEAQVRFWRKIFAEYSTHQVVLHDALDLNKVYGVLDFRQHVDDGMSDADLDHLQRVETDIELERVRTILLRLHTLGGATDGLTAEERKIYDLYKDDPADDRFLQAASDKRLRSQRGLREKFAHGLAVARHYWPEMERIFREEGLPTELTRLPLVESCFNVMAYSKVGAAGIWQFMPSTGRRFLDVGRAVDERRDPIASTRAAARFLREMHDNLDTWPLTITAYNHGPAGIARAVRELGTADIGTIVRDYRGSAFGFASRNFYAEFLAAVDVAQHWQDHFETLPACGIPSSREVRLERAVGIEVAARLAGTDRDTLADLNPALMRPVTDGKCAIPRGYRLRVPESGRGFEVRLAQLGAESDAVRETAPHRDGVRLRTAALTYRVRSGQSLEHIAKHHKVSVAALRKANGLGKVARLKPGQRLRIPRST
jgi:membrane-bound lytic murein transglycosylase D